MTSRGFDEWMMPTILAEWDKDRDDAVKLLGKVDRRREIQQAVEMRRKAWNYFLTNSLYLPDSVTDHARKIFDTLKATLLIAQSPISPPPNRPVELRKEASDLTWELRKKLQVALGVPVDKTPTETDLKPE